MSTLLVYAAPREGEAVAHTHGNSLALGVGKIAAASALTRALCKDRPDAVLLFGVCGAYPDRHLRSGVQELQILDLCTVASEIVVDDGVQMPDGFRDLEQLELARIGPYLADTALTGRIGALLDCPSVCGATVSTGAGVDALSQVFALRSGASVESMEGAAVASVCEHFEVPYAQLRVVSNRTGDRDKGAWDLDGAIDRLGRAMNTVLEAGILP